MIKTVIIAQTTPEARQSLEKMLRHYELDEHVEVVPQSLPPGFKGPHITLCDQTSVSKNTNQLVFPLRIGGVLDILRKQEKAGSQNLTYAIGPYTLNVIENELTHTKTQEKIRLTDKETDILIFLHDHKSRDTDKETLLKHIWGYSEMAETHTIETHIYRLRQKIETDPAQPTIVMTGQNGYILVE